MPTGAHRSLGNCQRHDPAFGSGRNNSGAMPGRSGLSHRKRSAKGDGKKYCCNKTLHLTTSTAPRSDRAPSLTRTRLGEPSSVKLCDEVVSHFCCCNCLNIVRCNHGSANKFHFGYDDITL